MSTKTKLEPWEKKVVTRSVKGVTKRARTAKRSAGTGTRQRKPLSAAQKAAYAARSQNKGKRKYTRRNVNRQAQDGETISFNVPVQLYLRFPRVQQLG